METFFTNLFKGKPAEQLITLWTLSNKTTKWFKSVDDFEEESEQVNGDVYYGLGTSSKNNGPSKRILAKDIEGIGTIHVDIDFGTTGHKSNNLPPDFNAAMKIANMIITPTYIINSGNGLHAYYFLENFVINKEDLKRIYDIQKQFQIMLNTYSEYDIDMTHDLSRVLRVPGSYNCKDPDNHKRCEIAIDNSQIRYKIETIAKEIEKLTNERIPAKKKFAQTDFDFGKSEEYEIETKTTTETIEQDSIAGIKILYNKTISIPDKYSIVNRRLLKTPTRQLETSIHYQLKDIFREKFEQAYEHTKKGAPIDCSPHDMELANMAASAGIPEQDICDLLIMHRAYHKKKNIDVNLKLTHPTYYGMTIYKAWQYAEKVKRDHGIDPEQEQELTSKEAKELCDNALIEHDDNTETKMKEAARINVKQILNGVEIYEVIKFDQDPEPKFEMIMKNHRQINLGSYGSCFASFKMFANRLYGHLMGKGVGTFKNVHLSQDDFDQLLAWISDITTTVVIEQEMFTVEKAREWLKDFRRKQSERENITEFKNLPGETLLHNNTFYFNMIHFFKFIKTNHENNINIQGLKTMLYKAFASPEIIIGQGDLSYKVWKIDSTLVEV